MAMSNGGGLGGSAAEVEKLSDRCCRGVEVAQRMSHSVYLMSKVVERRIWFSLTRVATTPTLGVLPLGNTRSSLIWLAFVSSAPIDIATSSEVSGT